MFTPYQMNGSTPRTQKRSRNGDRLSQYLRVSHQQVNLDVDIEGKAITGVTDIAIIPTSNSLRTIKLDCREMKITNVTVNNRKVNYVHQDLLYINNPDEFEEKIDSSSIDLFDIYSNELTIHQHHFIRQKLNYLFGDVNFDPREPTTDVQNGNTEELKIFLPDNFKFEQTDRYLSPEINHDSGTPAHLKRSTFTSDYNPIMIRIKYRLENPLNGLRFISGDEIDVKKWHVYTTNSEFNVSTSSWVPCIDNLWDKCTWTIELNIPRSTKELEGTPTRKPTTIGQPNDDHRDKDESKQVSEQEKDNVEHEVEDEVEDENPNDESDGNKSENEDLEDAMDDDDYQDLIVCAGDVDNYKELPHPSKRNRKLVSWSIFNPVCPHHVGWAVGPFQVHTFANTSNETNLDDEYAATGAEGEKDATSTPLTIYALHDDMENAVNTCAVLNGAMDFFLREFGSFPFTAYGVVCVHDSAVNVNNFAGLSVISERILFPVNIIEPLFTNTELLIDTLAEQWSGINITPQQFGDIWVTIGISRFMSLSYIRHLMGHNEFRFRVKIKKAQVADEDVGKKPLAYQFYQYPLSYSDLSFVILKAPVVLYILDKRMTKTDKSFGLSRVLPKIFLQAMSGDLQNSTLSTTHFQYVCEKVNRNKLETFFKQWVFNAGVPLFLVAQRFNKKRSIIEMQIRQIQLQIIRKAKPNAKNFVEDSIAYLDDEPSFLVQPVFTGPMTIRIHEANGTPYEHIIDLKHETSKLDIQYNTKFRRMKKKTGDDAQETVSPFKQLGDILQSKSEMEEWKLVDWVKDEEDPLFNDAFEWLRVDADLEWISKMSVKQPDYMFASQLQYDRDVEAQYEAIRFFATRDKPNKNYCTVLTRTIMDERYYYGVRVAAARALAGFSKNANQFVGLEYLLKIFKTLFCFPGSIIPKTNDFNDFSSYFLKKEMITIFATIRDDDGNSPTEVKHFLLGLLKYNDNTNNDFQDCFYVAELIRSLTSCAIITGDVRDVPDIFDQVKQKFVDETIIEINRLHKLDEWVPSYHSVVSVACLELKVELAVHGYLELPFEDLLHYTLRKFPLEVRLEAFKGLFVLGGLRNAAVMKYFLSTYLFTREGARFKRGLIDILSTSMSIVATGPAPSTLDDPEFNFYQALEAERLKLGTNKTNMMIIEDSMDFGNSRKEIFAKSSIEGAIELLRSKFAHGLGLQSTMWELLHISLLSLYERRRVFNLCQILYDEKDSFLVRLPSQNVPLEDFNKKFVAKYIGDNKVLIKREGRFKIQLSRLISIDNIDKKKRKLSINEDEEFQPKEKRPTLKFTNKLRPEKPEITHAKFEESQIVQERIGLVAIDGTLVNIKLSLRTLRSLAKSMSAPVAAPILSTMQSKRVTLKFKQENSKRVLLQLINGSTGPRYVKILTKESRVEISSEPFEEKLESSSAPLTSTTEPEVPEVPEVEDATSEIPHEASNGTATSTEETIEANKEVSATAPVGDKSSPDERKIENKTDNTGAPQPDTTLVNAEENHEAKEDDASEVNGNDTSTDIKEVQTGNPEATEESTKEKKEEEKLEESVPKTNLKLKLKVKK